MQSCFRVSVRIDFERDVCCVSCKRMLLGSSDTVKCTSYELCIQIVYVTPINKAREITRKSHSQRVTVVIDKT